MCHTSAGKTVPVMNSPCGCDCGCPGLPVEDEIERLEAHRKIRQDEIAAIDAKIAALRSVKGA
jgi:hypothetical protein